MRKTLLSLALSASTVAAGLVSTPASSTVIYTTLTTPLTTANNPGGGNADGTGVWFNPLTGYAEARGFFFRPRCSRTVNSFC